MIIKNPRDIHEWLARARAITTTIAGRSYSAWRRDSVKAMLRAVDALRVVTRPHTPSGREYLNAIDKAYPFGERAMHPYRMWLRERTIFIEAVTKETITPEQVGVAHVAADLMELGRVDEAKRLLEDEVPNLLARRCPACGSGPGRPCREPDPDAPPRLGVGRLTVMRDRIVPCQARLEATVLA